MKSAKITREINWSALISLFLIIYGFSVSGIDMRYPILVPIFGGVLLYCRTFYFPKYGEKILLFLMLMIVIAGLSTLVNVTGEYFEIMRFVRCGITMLLIVQIIYAFNLTAEKMYLVLKILLILNALAVVIGIIWPGFKEVIQPISQYNKAFSSYRSSGLFDGEDAAGYFCVIGLIMETVEKVYHKKSPLSSVSILFLVATVFTSRVSLLLAVVVLLVDVRILVKQHNYKHLIGLLIILVPMAIIMIVMWIMTTGFGMSYRQELITRFPFLSSLFDMLSSSYLDYGVFSATLEKHLSIDLNFSEKIFGVGRRLDVNKDVGYIKTIYSIGIIGVLLEVGFYLLTIKKVRKIKNQPSFVITTYSLMILIMILMELKNSFLFSSAVFEVSMCLYLALRYSDVQIRRTL